ncbi:HpcH/HpaI aldolase/citrate lyase family protein [Pseudomonas syringae]|uniref:HpcH/HpaI aldolase/citrate lyase family protein n=1 Tax=Pseudomonas syringae TaxID=317 RepID=UPI001F0D91A8|nr:CoA ester lyase [Pseudomonas syringae]MCH5520366.1 CoA ester lyase [Pseudomonas syringae pv. lapsa]
MQSNQLVRSVLFVPGSRPERFAKALKSGADVVIVDFEDAVEEDLKAQARVNLAIFLNQNPEASVVVRVNSADHPMHSKDIAFCAGHSGIAAVILPKAETAAQILRAADCNKPIWPLIESAAGVANIKEIAGTRAVQRLTFGALDLALDLGVRASSGAAFRVFDQVRYELLVNSALHDLEKPLDTVFPNIADTDGLSRFAQDARDLGFCGMLAIHPSQVEVINNVFTPSQSEIEWAQRIVEASAGAPGAFRLDGKMIDAPVIAAAKRIVSSFVA